MKSTFSNPKFFGAVAVLFAVSTLFNVGSFGNGATPMIERPSASPTMPPSPWDEPPVQKASPTMPPSPWDEPPAKL
jgi:hypothetical protein